MQTHTFTVYDCNTIETIAITDFSTQNTYTVELPFTEPPAKQYSVEKSKRNVLIEPRIDRVTSLTVAEDNSLVLWERKGKTLTAVSYDYHKYKWIDKYQFDNVINYQLHGNFVVLYGYDRSGENISSFDLRTGRPVDILRTRTFLEFDEDKYKTYDLARAALATVQKAGDDPFFAISLDIDSLGGDVGVGRFNFSGNIAFDAMLDEKQYKIVKTAQQYTSFQIYPPAFLINSEGQLTTTPFSDPNAFNVFSKYIISYSREGEIAFQFNRSDNLNVFSASLKEIGGGVASLGNLRGNPVAIKRNLSAPLEIFENIEISKKRLWQPVGAIPETYGFSNARIYNGIYEDALVIQAAKHSMEFTKDDQKYFVAKHGSSNINLTPLYNEAAKSEDFNNYILKIQALDFFKLLSSHPDYSKYVDNIERLTRRVNEIRNFDSEIQKLNGLFSHGSNTQESISELNQLIFTTIARLTLIGVILFLVGIIINLYKYFLRLSAYYGARADGLDIALATGRDLNTIVPKELPAIWNALSPDGVDPGGAHASPLKDITDAAVKVADSASKIAKSN